MEKIAEVRRVVDAEGPVTLVQPGFKTLQFHLHLVVDEETPMGGYWLSIYNEVFRRGADTEATYQHAWSRGGAKHIVASSDEAIPVPRLIPSFLQDYEDDGCATKTVVLLYTSDGSSCDINGWAAIQQYMGHYSSYTLEEAAEKFADAYYPDRGQKWRLMKAAFLAGDRYSKNRAALKLAVHV